MPRDIFFLFFDLLITEIESQRRKKEDEPERSIKDKGTT
jgi:hypothetical protein